MKEVTHFSVLDSLSLNRQFKQLIIGFILTGRDLDGVLKQYCTMVKPAFSHYIAPGMSHADIIVPRGGDNEVAIELIVHHVHTQLSLVRKSIVLLCNI